MRPEEQSRRARRERGQWAFSCRIQKRAGRTHGHRFEFAIGEAAAGQFALHCGETAHGMWTLRLAEIGGEHISLYSGTADIGGQRVPISAEVGSHEAALEANAGGWQFLLELEWKGE